MKEVCLFYNNKVAVLNWTVAHKWKNFIIILDCESKNTLSLICILELCMNSRQNKLHVTNVLLHLHFGGNKEHYLKYACSRF
jgi:hypothetical protein